MKGGGGGGGEDWKVVGLTNVLCIFAGHPDSDGPAGDP